MWYIEYSNIFSKHYSYFHIKNVCYHYYKRHPLIHLRRITMTTIKFDDYLEEELKDEEFKAGYLIEKNIL